MIIFIDTNGNENVIRNDNIAIDLFKRGSIKKDTLVKTSIRGEWKKAEDIEIFQNLEELINREISIEPENNNFENETKEDNRNIEEETELEIKEQTITSSVPSSNTADENAEFNEIIEDQILETEENTEELNQSALSSKTNETDTNKSIITSHERVKPNNIKVLKFFLYALMLSSLLMLVADINLYNLLNQFNNPTYVRPSNIDTIAENADNYVSIAAFINIGILIISYFFGGRWIYKSNLNLQNISSNKLRFSPGWSVGWYFIPIFSIWKPYQAMKEIYLTSQRMANPNKSSILPGSFIIWWFLWIIGNYLGWYYFRQSLTIDNMSLQEIIDLSIIGIVFDIIDVITVFMFLNIVKSINHFEKKIFN